MVDVERVEGMALATTAGPGSGLPGGAVPDRAHRQGGFSLVEIIVGIAILVFGLMGLAFAMITAYRVERVAAEKKIAFTWATSQIERVRTLGFSQILQAPSGNVGGYLVPTSDPVSPAGFRFKDQSTGPLYFERWFHVPGTADYSGITLADPLLAGLQPRDGMMEILTDPNQELWPSYILSQEKYQMTLMGRVVFRMPETAMNGVGEGSGYWVTARVMWKGASGPMELKLSTFVGR